MKVVFFGTPEFAVPSLDRLVQSAHDVVAVLSRPDKPVGRHQVLTPPPVVESARRHGLEVLQPKGLKSKSAADAVVETGADAAVVVAYGRLIPEALLERLEFGFVNLHPSLLPRHRGPSPIQWALVCGDRMTGVTTMRLDEGMDTGPILLQKKVTIESEDNAASLSERLSFEGAELIVETLDRLQAGTVEPRPQPDDGANVTPLLRRGFGKVDWTMPGRQLVNRLRGLTPWPGLFTKFRGGRLKIHGLETVPNAVSGDEKPGTVLSVDQTGIVVRCGRRSAVRVTELQREGRRRMPADAFLIGEQVTRGECFG